MGILASAVAALSTFYQGSIDPHDPDDVEITHDPPHRQDADHRGVRVQEVDRPAVRLPGQQPRLREQLPADDVRGPGRAVRGRPGRRAAPCASCSSSTPTTSRTARPRRCAWSAPATPTCTPRSRPASAPCGARSTAARTRRSSRCSSRSRPTAATSRKFVDRAKDKDDPFRLMGFGHRVYKNYDPRARIIKAAADTILAKLGAGRPRCSTSPASSRRSRSSDQYFVERKLYPNVDFYSGLIYRALGLPDRHVHRAVRHRAPARLDRPVAGDDDTTRTRGSGARASSTSARRSACPL